MNFYEEKIEAYLSGKLNAADKLALEEGMTKDPLLKNEVELQNDIIESLKNSRKIQLKNRLNSIDMSTGTSTGVSSAVKIAASFITVGIVGAGIYYFSILSTTKDNVTVVLNENVQVPQLQNNDSNSNQSSEVVTLTKEQVEALDKNVSQKSTSVKASKNSTNTKNTNQEITAQANVPNGVIDDTESDRINRDLTINIPDGTIGETNVGKAENVDVDVDDKNKKDFSYKYYSNKLFLYGDFNEQPYNLFEVNSSKSKHLYLFFDGKYYELKSNQTKLTRLKEVKDPSVLKHLNK